MLLNMTHSKLSVRKLKKKTVSTEHSEFVTEDDNLVRHDMKQHDMHRKILRTGPHSS